MIRPHIPLMEKFCCQLKSYKVISHILIKFSLEIEAKVSNYMKLEPVFLQGHAFPVVWKSNKLQKEKSGNFGRLYKSSQK